MENTPTEIPNIEEATVRVAENDEYERAHRLRQMNNIYRKRCYYKNLDKEREDSRARYYTRRGLPVPPKRN